MPPSEATNTRPAKRRRLPNMTPQLVESIQKAPTESFKSTRFVAPNAYAQDEHDLALDQFAGYYRQVDGKE